MTATLDEVLAGVAREHRVNYHHRNVGGETAAALRYTSCEGCDWLGGWHDESGWEAHLAAEQSRAVAEWLRSPEVQEVAVMQIAEWLSDYGATEAHRDAAAGALDAVAGLCGGGES